MELLKFKIISQRYEKKFTFITAHKVLTEWGEIFPNAACVVSIIDRLVNTQIHREYFSNIAFAISSVRGFARKSDIPALKHSSRRLLYA